MPEVLGFRSEKPTGEDCVVWHRLLATTLGVAAKAVRLKNVEQVDDKFEIREGPRMRHRWRCPTLVGALSGL
jgi:hypothetical protein